MPRLPVLIVAALLHVSALASPLPVAAAGSAQALYEQGLALAYDKEYRRAIVLLSRALALEPRNQDIRLAVARVHSWSGDNAQAQAFVSEVLAVAPDNPEAQILQARLFFQEGEYKQAETVLAGVASTEEVIALRDQIAQARKGTVSQRFYAAMSYERSDISRSAAPDWKQLGFVLGYRVSDKVTLQLSYERAYRFNRHNEFWELGVETRFSERLLGRFALGVAADGDFLAERRARAGLEWRIGSPGAAGGDTWGTFDLQHTTYASGVKTTSFSPGIRFRLNDTFALHGKLIRSHENTGARHKGWSLRADWQTPWNGLALNFGYSIAPETEGGPTVDVRT